MVMINMYFAWAWMLTGMVAGAVIGMFFHREEWLGGFGSWRRRMLRLGHIAFLGTGLLNVSFALCVPLMVPEASENDLMLRVASMMFIVGGATMPTVCLLSAWRKPIRHLFFIPAMSLMAAAAVFLIRGVMA